MKILMLLVLGLLIAERKYNLRIAKVRGTTKLAVFYDTAEEDEEGNPKRDYKVLFDIGKIFKDEEKH